MQWRRRIFYKKPLLRISLLIKMKSKTLFLSIEKQTKSFIRDSDLLNNC